MICPPEDYDTVTVSNVSDSDFDDGISVFSYSNRNPQGQISAVAYRFAFKLNTFAFTLVVFHQF